MITVDCPTCRKKTPHIHRHDTAHGIPGTHMAGSERWQCIICDHAILVTEGVKLGLPYTLDKKAAA